MQQMGAQQDGEQDYTGAMELLAMLFQGNMPAQMLSDMSDSAQAQQLMQEVQALMSGVEGLEQGMLQPQAILQQLESGAFPQLKNLLTQAKEQPNEFSALLQKSGLSEQEAQSLQQMIQGSTLTQETSVDVKKLFEAYSARNAQQNDVKASLNQTAQDDTAEEMLPDADALQAQMNLRSDALSQQMKMGQIAAVDKNAQAEEPIVKQVTQQMQLNLEKGSSEFTIRLRPENLGEITVKLVQKDGAMTLLLAADNENTKKLLNTNLEALREAVRPMQVEVREAVVQAQQSDGQDMSRQMDMSNGQFLGQQQAQQMLQDNSRHRANGVSWEAWLNGETDEEAATPEQAVQAAKVIAENLMDVYF